MKDDLYTVLYAVWRRKEQWVDIVLRFENWWKDQNDEQCKMDFMPKEERRCAGGFVAKRTIEAIESKETENITALFIVCRIFLYCKSVLLLSLWVDD